jgi:dTDP-4-dehydrorhamnose 3,5-epimerase
LEGEILDVAVDIRLGSPTFGRSLSFRLSSETKKQVYLPEGFAHGFCVTSSTALVAYKCTRPYEPRFDRGICWNDPQLEIDWPIAAPLLSPKDASLPMLRNIPKDLLPRFE